MCVFAFVVSSSINIVCICGFLYRSWLRGPIQSSSLRRLVEVPAGPVDGAELELHELLARRGVLESALDLVARYDASDARGRAREHQVALLRRVVSRCSTRVGKKREGAPRAS